MHHWMKLLTSAEALKSRPHHGAIPLEVKDGNIATLIHVSFSFFL
jgi:hypothetical protein